MQKTLELAIKKMAEIRDKRYCGCSRENVVEKMSFDRVISAMSDCETAEEAENRLESIENAISPTNRDKIILKNAYKYGVAVIHAVQSR